MDRFRRRGEGFISPCLRYNGRICPSSHNLKLRERITVVREFITRICRSKAIIGESSEENRKALPVVVILCVYISIRYVFLATRLNSSPGPRDSSYSSYSEEVRVLALAVSCQGRDQSSAQNHVH